MLLDTTNTKPSPVISKHATKLCIAIISCIPETMARKYNFSNLFSRLKEKLDLQSNFTSSFIRRIDVEALLHIIDGDKDEKKMKQDLEKYWTLKVKREKTGKHRESSEENEPPKNAPLKTKGLREKVVDRVFEHNLKVKSVVQLMHSLLDPVSVTRGPLLEIAAKGIPARWGPVPSPTIAPGEDAVVDRIVRVLASNENSTSTLNLNGVPGSRSRSGGSHWDASSSNSGTSRPSADLNLNSLTLQRTLTSSIEGLLPSNTSDNNSKKRRRVKDSLNSPTTLVFKKSKSLIDGASHNSSIPVGRNRSKNSTAKNIPGHPKVLKIRGRKQRQSSKYHGVGWETSKSKWRVRVFYKGQRHYVGSFRDEKEAARAYDREIIKQGLDRVLNFPDEAKANEKARALSTGRELDKLGRLGGSSGNSIVAHPLPHFRIDRARNQVVGNDSGRRTRKFASRTSKSRRKKRGKTNDNGGFSSSDVQWAFDNTFPENGTSSDGGTSNTFRKLLGSESSSSRRRDDEAVSKRRGHNNLEWEGSPFSGSDSSFDLLAANIATLQSEKHDKFDF
eukprot:g2494.t1